VKGSALIRFVAKVQPESTGCWTWAGAVDPNGYPRFWIDDRWGYAHRAAHELFVGPIPEGHEVDHTCHNDSECAGGRDCLHRRCVNPLHLEPVEHRTNVLRGRTLARAHHAGTDCGFAACVSCARHRVAA
jgi:hypothetical protein